MPPWTQTSEISSICGSKSLLDSSIAVIAWVPHTGHEGCVCAGTPQSTQSLLQVGLPKVTTGPASFGPSHAHASLGEQGTPGWSRHESRECSVSAVSAISGIFVIDCNYSFCYNRKKLTFGHPYIYTGLSTVNNFRFLTAMHLILNSPELIARNSNLN